MAAGPLLAPAVREVAALPPDAYERAVAEPILLQLQHMLGQDSNQDPDEQEFIMAMLKSWEEGKAEARAEARAEASTETQANAVLAVLRVRGIAIPDDVRGRILASKDLEQLKRWHENAVVASSISEVIDDPAIR
jgi:ribonuclease D